VIDPGPGAVPARARWTAPAAPAPPPLERLPERELLGIIRSLAAADPEARRLLVEVGRQVALLSSLAELRKL
jgi:hypothetical protein